MTKKNPVAYCPNCKMNVNLKREGINIPFAILLGIFTGGIGLLIYLAIYYNRAEDRCAQCRTRISVLQTNSYEYQTKSTLPTKGIEEVKGEKIFFCPLCGEQLNGRNTKFCSNCGSTIDLE